MPPLWRFIDSGDLDGSVNMAVDEALFRSLSAPDARPVLRLYGWCIPTLTAGRFQKVRDAVALERCGALQIPVVRRFTGGALVYHSQEVAYSVSCSPHHLHGCTGQIQLSHLVFSSLLRFFAKLGLSAAPRPGADSPRRSEGLLCCLEREPWDIMVEGRKVGGHAMRRQRGALFQHGTIPLAADFSEMTPLLRSPLVTAPLSSSLADFGLTPDRAEIARLFLEAFSDTLSVDFVADTLQPDEDSLARKLMVTRYGRPSWNLDGRMA